MSNEKITNRTASNDPVSGIRTKTVDAKTPAKDVKVVSLEIDENDDYGGDPYNHTGSFLRAGVRRPVTIFWRWRLQCVLFRHAQ